MTKSILFVTVLASLLPVAGFANGGRRVTPPSESFTQIESKKGTPGADRPGIATWVVFVNPMLVGDPEFSPLATGFPYLNSRLISTPPAVEDRVTFMKYRFADKVYLETIKARRKCYGEKIADKSIDYFSYKDFNSLQTSPFHKLNEGYRQLLENVGVCLLGYVNNQFGKDSIGRVLCNGGIGARAGEGMFKILRALTEINPESDLSESRTCAFDTTFASVFKIADKNLSIDPISGVIYKFGQIGGDKLLDAFGIAHIACEKPVNEDVPFCSVELKYGSTPSTPVDSM